MNEFNFGTFVQFLKTHNVFSTVIAAVLSDRIAELTDIFVNSIIMPIINRDTNRDGVRDVKVLEDKILYIDGAKIEIGKFFVAIIKFIIVTYSIFLIARLVKKIASDD